MSNFIRNYDATRFKWFVLVGEGLDKINRGGTFSFRNYTDHADAHGRGAGKMIEYVASRDAKGKDVPKWFVLDESRRRLQVRETDRDINGISQYSFLKFYPECEGSPNGDYVEVDGIEIQRGIVFRELDNDKDADVAVEAEINRTLAKESVIKLDPTTLQEIAAFTGYFGKPGSRMLLTVLEFADKRPADYQKVLNAGDRSIRALVRKAVADGLFTQRGSVIYWESTMIGADEDAAVSTLLKDKQILEALRAKVDLGKPLIEVNTPPTVKNKGGRPKGARNKPKAETTTENSL